MTQLLVIDTNKMTAKAYDGKVFIQELGLGIDEETTREGLIEALEDVRAISTVQFKEAQRQLDLLLAQQNDAKRWAPKNQVKVTFKELKRVVQ